MRRVWMAVAVIVFAATARAQQPLPMLAVVPLRAEGLQANEAGRLDVLVRARAGSSGQFRVMSAEETTSLLEAAQDLGVNCDPGLAACGARFGRVAAVDIVVVGHAARMPAPSADALPRVGLELTLVDVKTAVVRRTVHALLPGEPSAQVAALDDVTKALFGDDALAEATIDVTPAGARILVDGIEVGSAPMPGPVAGLLPGTHIVEARAPRMLSSTQVVEVVPGAPVALTLHLVRDPDAERVVVDRGQVVAAFSTAAGGLLVAIAGGVVAGVAGSMWSEYEAARADVEAKSRPVVDATALHAANVRLDDATNAWGSTGSPMAIGGGVGLGVGSALAIAATTWGLLLLPQMQQADADAP